MNMNLNVLKEKLLDLGKNIGLQVQEETSNSLTLHANIVAKDYFENSIYLNMTIYEGGSMHIFFTFDETERTYDNLYLINNFNAKHPWFKGYISNINDKDYFEIHYASLDEKDEEAVIESVGYLLNNILKEDTLDILKPIIINGKAN